MQNTSICGSNYKTQRNVKTVNSELFVCNDMNSSLLNRMSTNPELAKDFMQNRSAQPNTTP